MKSEQMCVPAGWTQRCIEALIQRDPSLPAGVAAEMAIQMATLGLWRDNDPGRAVKGIFQSTAASERFNTGLAEQKLGQCLVPPFWTL